MTQLAELWDYRTAAIVTAAERLGTLRDDEREHAITDLAADVRAQVQALDDGSLVATATFMVDDLYKSYYAGFRWIPTIVDYLGATASEVIDELARRGMVVHYVVDNMAGADDPDVLFTYLPAIFRAAGLLPVGPQLLALKLLAQTTDECDASAISRVLAEGQHLAEQLVARCHSERRSSAYLNLDLDPDGPALSLDVALSAANQPGTLVLFRNQPPVAETSVQIAMPPGVALPDWLNQRGEDIP